jgi:hypothetical protein
MRDVSGKMYQAPGSIHENMQKARGGKPFYLGSFIVNGSADLDVPAGAYTVVAEHGLEYGRVEREVDVSAESPARLSFRLTPWIRMRRKVGGRATCMCTTRKRMRRESCRPRI